MLVLVLVIMYARTLLVASGDVHIMVNDADQIATLAGGKLLGTLVGEMTSYLFKRCTLVA